MIARILNLDEVRIYDTYMCIYFILLNARNGAEEAIIVCIVRIQDS